MTFPNPNDLLPEQRPDVDTGISRAWRVDIAAAKVANEAQRALNVDAWVIYAPWAHPVWHSYALFCISLRDVAGWPPAHINFAGVTHEVLCMALDPSPAPGRKYVLGEPLPFLHPLNFTGQFRCESDDVARRICAETVSDIAQALLNPDTDARSVWEQRYGQANIKGIDKAHLRYERRVHPRDPLAAWDAPVHFHLAPGGHA